MSNVETKLEWYYQTTDEDDYELHVHQYQGVVDYYGRLGYDWYFDHGELETGTYYVTLEIFRVPTKDDYYKDGKREDSLPSRPYCSECT